MLCQSNFKKTLFFQVKKFSLEARINILQKNYKNLLQSDLK